MCFWFYLDHEYQQSIILSTTDVNVETLKFASEKSAWLFECTQAVTPAICTNIIFDNTRNEPNTFEVILEAMEYQDLESTYQEIAINGLFVTNFGTFSAGKVCVIFTYTFHK